MHSEIHRYAIADGVLGSNVPLPELQPASAGPTTWQFLFTGRRFADGDASLPEPFHVWPRPNGKAYLQFFRLDERVVLRFPRLGDFVVSPAARTIECYPRARIGLSTLRPTLFNQVIPLLYARERLVLHAAAVQMGSEAVAFVGTTGAGKSTLAAALARRGCPFITDDVMLLDHSADEICAIPSRMPLRLWTDSTRLIAGRASAHPRVRQRIEKRLITVPALGAREAAGPIPLKRIFLLGRTPDHRAHVGAISPAKAALALIRCSFQIAVDDLSVSRETLRAASLVAARVSSRRLLLPASLKRLDRTLDAIQADVLSSGVRS